MSSSKQRLWIISELFPPEETSTAYIMGKIADAFSHKYDVGVLCGPQIYDTSRKRISNQTSRPREYQILHTKCHTFNKNSLTGKARSFLSTTLSLYKLAKKHLKEGDKVLMVTNPAPLILLMSRLKKKRHLELNILVHDVFPENTVAAGIRLPFYGFIKALFDKAYSNADKLIVLGRDMADLMVKKTKGRVDLHIIENWGDFENIKNLPMPDSNKIILQYAGNIGRVQGLDRIIKTLPDVIEFHIYGSGAMEDKLRGYNKPNVYFHGPYTRYQQSEILSKCHISLVTLNDKMYGLGTPSKTYNILASGRPILYFGPQNSEIELLIKDHNIGYTSWPEYWDIETLHKMGKQARLIGERFYSEKSILNKFSETI